MTAKQNHLYFRAWGKAKAVYVQYAGYSPKEAEALRHELHREALGADKSHTAFSNEEFDAVLDAFEAVTVLSSGPSEARDRASTMPLRRAIYGIEKYGLADSYVAHISADQFGTPDWRSLPIDVLRALRSTCRKRARSKSAKHVHDSDGPSDTPF
jgi:hypothetical protein